MKKTFILFCLLFSLFSLAQGQQKEIDSLDRVLEQIQDNKIKSAKLSNIITNHQKQNPEVLLYFIRKAISHNLAFKDSISYGKTLLEYGVYYYTLRKADSAILIFQKAELVFNKINYHEKDCFLWKQFAQAYRISRNYVEAINYNLKALECFEKEDNVYTRKNILRIKTNMGIVYRNMRDYEKASMCWDEVFSDSLTKLDRKLLCSVSINLCNLKRSQGLYKEAINYGLLAIDSAQDTRTLCRVYINLGAAYGASKQYDKGYDCFLKSLELSKELKDTLAIQQNLHNIGYLFKKKGDYKNALKYFLSSNAEIKKRGDLNVLQRSYQGLSELCRDQGDFKKALEYQTLEYQVRDSIFGIEKLKAVTDSETKYETEKTKREKVLAEKNTKIAQLKSKQNRNLFVGTLIIAALILLSSLFYFSRVKTKKKIELTVLELNETQKRLDVEKRYRDSELKALKAQMNPHFIFNALNSIQDYILLNQKNLASDYLAKFAELIRNYLHFSDTGYISIRDEIDNLKLYLELEKIRFEEELDYNFKFEKSINSDKTKIPTMLIQPYVENALKHGLLHKEADRKLTISFSKTSETTIECIIEDNGVGREKSQLINERRGSLHKSFAMKATAERLDLLNHGKENKINIQIIDLMQDAKAVGTKVILRIPIL